MYRVIVNRSKEALRNYFLARIGFWSGELYHFVGGAEIALKPEGSSSTKWIIIVGREYYFESTKDYPIANKSDLKKVLKNESWRFPYDGLWIKQLNAVSPQVQRVTSWIIKHSVFEKTSVKPILVVPESACLQYFVRATGSAVAVDRLGETLYVAETPDGLVSSLGDGTAKLGDFGLLDKDPAQSSDVASSSFGLAAYLTGLYQIILSKPHIFMTGRTFSRLKSIPARAALVAAASVFFAYVVLSSAYLTAANTLIDYKLTQGSDGVESSLKTLNELKAYAEEAAKLKTIFSDIDPLWVAWDVLLDLKATEAIVRAVNKSSEGVTYFLTANSATEILGWFVEDSRILSAEFALPVRKVNGQDEFAIKVKFDPQINIKVASE